MKPKKKEAVVVDDKDYEVEQIVGHKFVGLQTWFKIRWKGYAAADDTWQSEKAIDCPDLVRQYKEDNPEAVRSLPPLMEALKKEKLNRKDKAASVESGDSDASVTDGRDWEVRRVMDVHYCQNGTREFLIRWKGYNGADDTWEPEAHLSCGDLIEKYMAKIEQAKISEPKELRIKRKHTERLVYMDPAKGRRLSRRQDGRKR